MSGAVGDDGVAGGVAHGMTSVAEILNAVGREIGGLGRCAAGLQIALSPLGQALAQEDSVIEAFQALDLLTQQLDGLAAFLAAIAPTMPDVWKADAATAAQAVTVSDLARRLARPMQNENRLEDAEAGRLELFEALG